MKRTIDIFLSVGLIIISLPIAVTIVATILMTSPGPILYWSRRIGRDCVVFEMPKFRTMRVDTPAVATHLLVDPAQWLTPCGSFLRSSSLDEIPQLWSVVVGKMSFVGPRPALFNQEDLLDLREKFGLNGLIPGITGWAQVNGRDKLSIPEKVELERQYAERRSIRFDVWILLLTIWKLFTRDGVSH